MVELFQDMRDNEGINNNIILGESRRDTLRV